MIIVSKRFLKLCTGNFAVAITLFPFVIVRSEREKENPILINHERIHWKQQIEMLVLFFYIWYFVEYIYYRWKGHTHNEAYLKISFEKEACINEEDLGYLQNRPLYSFRKYL